MSRIRPAVLSEVPSLSELVTASARELSRGSSTPSQIDLLIRYVFGVDTQLLIDETYYSVERDDRVLACGGWSGRRLLFGWDEAKKGVDPPLDPARDPARIRAFFVHPRAARQGLGRRPRRRISARRAHVHVARRAVLPGPWVRSKGSGHARLSRR